MTLTKDETKELIDFIIWNNFNDYTLNNGSKRWTVKDLRTLHNKLVGEYKSL